MGVKSVTIGGKAAIQTSGTSHWSVLLTSLPTDTVRIVAKDSSGNQTTRILGLGYGKLTDARDGQVYKTVKISTQTWFAQNLNFRKKTSSTDTVGVCYNSSADSCTKYGRLYTWSEVMAGSTSSSTSPSGVQGVCPTGWHVPSDAEWSTLTTYIGGESTAGTKLKSTSGWNSSGTDIYGFRALPGGGISGYVGSRGYWWSATEYSGSSAWRRGMSDNANVYRDYYGKTDGVSLRCAQD
jgi:uncharacterized protein (TIGR02145 family)